MLDFVQRPPACEAIEQVGQPNTSPLEPGPNNGYVGLAPRLIDTLGADADAVLHRVPTGDLKGLVRMM